MSITGMTVRKSDGTVMELVPPTVPDTDGELWYLKSWLEIPKDLPGGSVSNFSALTLYSDPLLKNGGQTCWLELGPAEIELIQRVNNAPYGSPRWHYLVVPSNTGGIYMVLDTDEDMPGAPLRWFRIALGSKEDGLRNIVKVRGKNAYGNAVSIAGIPRSNDYSNWSPDKQPWAFHRVYCYYQNAGDHSKSVIGDTPQGIMYMPIFDATTGFKSSLGGTEMWLPAEYLHSQVGAQPQPAEAIQHTLLTIDDPALMIAHLYTFDLTKVVPFVTPALGYKLTPKQYAEKYNLDLVINGDQGPWLLSLLQHLHLSFGILASTGRWMSNGKWISQSTAESSIWFNQAGACKISYAKPTGFTPWNVISGPKWMIKDGVATRVFDDTFIAARSAFGLFDATHAGVLAIEGNEYTQMGATEHDLFMVGMMWGLKNLMELDSGGSTGVEQKNGVSYSVEQRPVLNALGFRVKT